MYGLLYRKTLLMNENADPTVPSPYILLQDFSLIINQQPPPSPAISSQLLDCSTLRGLLYELR